MTLFCTFGQNLLQDLIVDPEFYHDVYMTEWSEFL